MDKQSPITISVAENGYMVDTTNVSKGMIPKIYVYENFDNLVEFLRSFYDEDYNKLPPGAVIRKDHA